MATYGTFSDDKAVIGYYRRYPYDAQALRLTQVYWESGDHHLLGVRIGDTQAEAAEAVAAFGYTPREGPVDSNWDPGYRMEKYRNGRVVLQFGAKVEDGVIDAIGVVVYEVDPNLAED